MNNVTPIRKVLHETLKVEAGFTIDFNDKSIQFHDELSQEQMAAYLVLLRLEWKPEWGECPILTEAEVMELDT